MLVSKAFHSTYGKIVEDVRRAWEHYPIYVDVNSE